MSFQSHPVPKVSSPFELVHSNVWCHVNFASNDFHYFVTLVDDHSHMTWIFLMKNHSKLFSIFKLFREDLIFPRHLYSMV